MAWISAGSREPGAGQRRLRTTGHPSLRPRLGGACPGRARAAVRQAGRRAGAGRHTDGAASEPGRLAPRRARPGSGRGQGRARLQGDRQVGRDDRRPRGTRRGGPRGAGLGPRDRPRVLERRQPPPDAAVSRLRGEEPRRGADPRARQRRRRHGPGSGSAHSRRGIDADRGQPGRPVARPHPGAAAHGEVPLPAVAALRGRPGRAVGPRQAGYGQLGQRLFGRRPLLSPGPGQARQEPAEEPQRCRPGRLAGAGRARLQPGRRTRARRPLCGRGAWAGVRSERGAARRLGRRAPRDPGGYACRDAQGRGQAQALRPGPRRRLRRGRKSREPRRPDSTPGHGDDPARAGGRGARGRRRPADRAQGQPRREARVRPLRAQPQGGHPRPGDEDGHGLGEDRAGRQEVPRQHDGRALRVAGHAGGRLLDVDLHAAEHAGRPARRPLRVRDQQPDEGHHGRGRHDGEVRRDDRRQRLLARAAAGGARHGRAVGLRAAARGPGAEREGGRDAAVRPARAVPHARRLRRRGAREAARAGARWRDRQGDRAALGLRRARTRSSFESAR